MHSKNILINLPALIITILLINIPLFAQDTTKGVMDINNITSWVMDNGFHPPIVGIGGLPGTYNLAFNGNFPKGTAGGVFIEGIVWGGKVYDGNSPLVRVNGSTGFNGNYPLTRIFRVRTFYDKKYLRNDAANTFLVPESQVTDSMINVIYEQYQKDWDEWPADKGAPFYDKNKDGKYEPDIDIPGIPGASQTIWISYDDRNSMNSYASPPIGLEVQQTFWAYDDEEKLNDVIFQNDKLIYKGLSNSDVNSHIDSMFIVNYVDIDVGSYFDDFAGCDTNLSLGYEYNSSDTDKIYSKYLNSIPAIGSVFIHGVAEKTNNLSDSAIVDLRWRKGYKYFNSKPMTVFIAHRVPDVIGEPEPGNYNGTLEFYSLMRGYLPQPYPTSVPYVNNVDGVLIGGYGTYMLPGDPINKTGWYDGLNKSPGDRWMFLVTGPFNLKLGDTAEVSLLLVGGLSANNITSVFSLKYNTEYAILSFNTLVRLLTSGAEFSYTPPVIAPPTLPDYYVLTQNYPNPFNPTTTIEYDLPKDAFVKLVVYDILGREVKTLVNENKAAGSYKVQFDSSNLSSGVYFCRITFTNSDSKLANDNLSKVIKMMVLK